MAEGDRETLSSAFDDMLTETRRELDALYGGRLSSDPQPSVPEPAPLPASPRPERSGPPPTEAERFLTDRYGDRWRQEILERRRDGDEVVVLAKLIIEDQDIAKTQFGSARLGGAAGGGVAGTSGGLSFSLGGGAASDPDRDAEAAAYRAAAQDALAKCVAML